MHLTKEDIEHVAWSRFNKEKVKYYYLLVFGGLAALAAFTLGLNRLFPENMWPTVAADVPIFALTILGTLRYDKAQRRAAQELVKQCELDPHLIYVSDTEPVKEEAIVTK